MSVSRTGFSSQIIVAVLMALPSNVPAQAHAKSSIILIDPALKGLTAPKLPAGADPEKVLSSYIAHSPRCAWVRIDLNTGANVPSAGRLASFVREAERSQSTLLVEGDGGRNVRAISHGPNTGNAGLSADETTIYLIYDKQAYNSLSAQERFHDQQVEQGNLLTSMQPSRMQNPMMAWMQRIQGHGKEEIERAMAPLLTAGMKVWENTSADQRSQMMQEAKGVMEGFKGAAPSSVSRNYLSELRSTAAVMSRKFGSEILVDPAIFLSTAPNAAPSSSLATILNELCGSGAEIQWRAVYLPDGTNAKDFGAKEIAKQVRWMERQPIGHVKVTSRGAVHSFSASGQSSEDLAARLKQRSLQAKTVYLIYSPSGIAESAEEQYSTLQRDQMEQMLHMTPEELGVAMEQAGQLYASTDADKRGRLMGLPVMAAMMGVWLPRAAKEKM